LIVNKRLCLMRSTRLQAARLCFWNAYADRYRDYREHPSQVSGEFRSLLADWHMARDFGMTPPTLNGAFVTCDPTNRIYADQTGTDTMYYDGQSSSRGSSFGYA